MDRRFLRPGWIAGHLLVLAAALTCLRLGWWQWERAHDYDGTGQNLGYSMLWPAFAAAFIYMWVRFLRLEKIKQAEDEERAGRDLAELLTEIDPPAGNPDALADAHADAMADAHADATVDANAGAHADADAGTAPPEPAATADDQTPAERPNAAGRQRPSQGYVLSVATVEIEDADDPELTAYNRALAALAEEDRRRARRPRR